MNDLDGVYLDGTRVSSDEEINTNYQANDLSRPATLQMSYSDTFSMPDTVANRRLTGHAEQLDSGSRWPYTTHEARVISGGEIIFEGIAEFDHYSNGWELALYEEKRTLFDRLDRSLKTIDLSQYNHEWSLEEINRHADASDGICYPLIDYGLLKDGIIPSDAIFPAVFVKTILAQMLYEEGYTLVGDLPNDLLYKSLIIPFTDSEPTSYDQQWVDDRSSRVTFERPTDEVSRSLISKSNWLDRIQPYNLDSIDTFYQGVLKNFDTKTFSYICDTAMNLEVRATQLFKVLCLSGSVEIILSVVKNGQDIDNARFESGAGYNPLFIRTDRLTLNSTVKCKAGDRIQIRLIARRQTNLGNYRIQIFNDPDNSFVSFIPKLTTSIGDLWNVPRNLPDITCIKLLVGLAQLFGGTWLVDNKRKQVSFSKLSDIVYNTENAVNWSNRLDTGTEPQLAHYLEPYGQANLLAWKEIDETKKAAVMRNGKLINYGDGIMYVNGENLELDVPLFELPFSASTDSNENIPGYGNPVLVKTRTVTGKKDNISISNQDTTARLLLVSLTKKQPITITRLKDDSVTLEKVIVNLKPCWFGKRPETIFDNDTRFSLSFDKLNINQNETCIIERNYEGLSKVLRRMRVLTVSMRLKPIDIANLNFRKPILLERVVVGGLVLSTHFFYLNKINGYQSDRPCSVTLVAF